MKRAAAVLVAALSPLAGANDGIATRGATGGLTVPSAQVLKQGDAAFTFSNFEEPLLGQQSRQRSLTFGIGLIPNLELFGRYANYENPLPGSGAINGIRDISANLKYRLPKLWHRQPDVAVGVTDIGGGANNFSATYLVASDRYSFVDWSIGYARSGSIRGTSPTLKTFDGVFGSVALRAGDTGLAAIAEYDGQTKYAGLRYRSAPVAPLLGANFLVSVQRSFGATDPTGQKNDQTSATVSVVVPFTDLAERPRTFKPERALRSLDAPADAMGATRDDRLESIRRILVAARMERVRVGTVDRDLVVEYENHVFGQTEADALGVVLGTAAELAPAGVQRVRAITLKVGLPIHATSVNAAEYRGFLRNGDANFVSGSVAVDAASSHRPDAVQWLDPRPGRRSYVNFELGPELANTVATELGVFDYSVAANLRSYVPLWRGGELFASYVQRIDNTQNFEPINYFGGFRQRNGVRTLALQQTMWLGSHMLLTAGVGRYRYDNFGAEIESTLFVPGRSDVIRLKAAAYESNPGERRAQAFPASATYRWAPSHDAWVEAGFQQYTDGTRGPSLVLTRWFGEVGANLVLRRGGTRTFGGLELTIPLTTRRGVETAGMTFNGRQQFTHGVRTRLISSGSINFVELGGVLDFPLQYDAQSRLLNGGHVSEKYFVSRLHRMREAFYLYARDALPQ